MGSGAVDAVIAWHPDRLYRKLSDLTRLLDVAKGIEFRMVTAGELDLSTPTGRMVASILGSVATAEVEHAAERKRRAFQQMAESGRPKWRKAFGYLDAGGDRRELDPATAPLVAQAYRDILAGASLNDICRTWTEAGATTINGKPWKAPQLSLFLRNPRNAGLRAYQAKRGKVDRDSIVGKGSWPPLVDEQTYWAAMALMDAPERQPGPKTARKYLLTGMLGCGKCGPGYHLSGLWGKDATDTVYVCKTCRGCSVRARYVEPLVMDLVAGRLAMPDAVDLLTAQEHDAAEAEQLRTEATTLLAEIDAIGMERADGLLTGRQAKLATDRLQAKLDAVQARMNDVARVRVFDGIPLGKKEVIDAVKGLSPDRFRVVMGVLMDVKVQPVGKGHWAGANRFDPERIKVVWHD